MRYFIGFLISIGLIVLIIVLLFHHGGSGKVPATKAPLISYSNSDTTVREIIDQTINAPQNHRTIQITVGRDTTTFELIQGYDGNPLNTKTYPMTASAYAVFLHALQHEGYTLGNDDSTLKDERGFCPLGTRYIFEVVDGSGSDIERFWTTSCGSGSPSTFKGKTATVLQLFQQQVPDYDTLTANLSGSDIGL